MDILLSLIAIIIGIVSLFVAIKMYIHSYRNICMSLDDDCKDTLSYWYSKEIFSGLIDLPFIFVNQGAKRIIVEKIILEKKIHPVLLPNTKVNLTKNFFVLYHFFISEETLLEKDEIIMESCDFGIRKYNILKESISLEPSDKYVFTFNIKEYFRHMYYFFDGKICSFLINKIYAIDTLGNIYPLDKESLLTMQKSSLCDCEVVESLANRIQYNQLITQLFLYHISLMYKEPIIEKEMSLSAMAFNRHLSIKEKDLQEYFSSGYDDIMPNNECLQHDEEIIKNSLYPPISKESIRKTSDVLGELSDLENIRDFMIEQGKSFKEMLKEKISKLLCDVDNSLKCLRIINSRRVSNDDESYIMLVAVVSTLNDLKLFLREEFVSYNLSFTEEIIDATFLHINQHRPMNTKQVTSQLKRQEAIMRSFKSNLKKNSDYLFS
ncbi:MAG: hypothetical protein D3914_05700 [Candidatus Electrothrix sp. LOE2]|nr:hypothetical protein [Candidatus Electrothrix sp. LOE2]